MAMQFLQQISKLIKSHFRKKTKEEFIQDFIKEHKLQKFFTEENLDKIIKDEKLLFMLILIYLNYDYDSGIMNVYFKKLETIKEYVFLKSQQTDEKIKLLETLVFKSFEPPENKEKFH